MQKPKKRDHFYCPREKRLIIILGELPDGRYSVFNYGSGLKTKVSTKTLSAHYEPAKPATINIYRSGMARTMRAKLDELLA